jgi:hypothetical protein
MAIRAKRNRSAVSVESGSAASAPKPARISVTHLCRGQTLKSTANSRYASSPPSWRGYFAPQRPNHIPFHPQIRRKNQIGKERIRRAGLKIKNDMGLMTKDLPKINIDNLNRIL